MGKKILLADDSITIQKVIELTFSDEDFEVVTVGNGRLAIERVQEVRPDVVLCDIIMPEKDGYEVCDFIKRHPQLGHVPVLLLTGAFEPFDQERAARVGCDGFLAKPFEPQTLIAKVKDLLVQSAARRAPVTPSRPVAAAAAAAPTPPSMPPFGVPRKPDVPASEPETSPAGVPSPFVRPAPAPPAPPVAAAMPAPPAPPPTLGSEFEIFYPTPEEIEPLAASAEFEPVFAPSDFEAVEPPSEYDTVEMPVVDLREAEPPAAPARWMPAEPDVPSFIPDEPFTDDGTLSFEPALPVAASEVPAEPVAPVDELFMSDEGLEDAFAPPPAVVPQPFVPSPAAEPAVFAPPAFAPPPAAEPPVRWSDATLDVPFEERAQASVAAAYGTPLAPPTFEESFDEPALTLESEGEVALPPAPAPAEDELLGPDDLVSEELFASEPEPESTETLAGVPAFEEAPAAEPEASESALFTALAEEDAVLEAAQAAPAADDLPLELPEASFSATEPSLTLDEAEIEPAALEPEPEVESAPLVGEALFDDVAEFAAPVIEAAPESAPEPALRAESFEPQPSVAAPEGVIPATEPLPVVAEPPLPLAEPLPTVAEPLRPEPVPEEVSFEDLAPAPAAVAAPAPSSAAATVAVPVEMVEQIARRVVAQLGDKVIREVAWEVVPDLAEVLIRREIDRLKAELDRLP